ncbi:MAG: T9SS type A sorting domain-containing protein [Bacteroidales bacterium]|nr:T9SS type A sorting domain-containing protein [Bacteroidales bacterium]
MRKPYLKLTLPIVALIMITTITQSQTLELFGVSKQGGTHDAGVIYKTDTSCNYQEVVHSFEKIQGGRPEYTQLCEADNGRLYGLTFEGGLYDHGTLFEYNPEDNSFVSKVDFQSPGPYGAEPSGSLVKASNGKLYGMTSWGGQAGSGTIFEYDPYNNSIKKKIDFKNEINGGHPKGSLIEASNGKLYGLTYDGGDNGNGVLFEYITSSNTFTALLHFDLMVTGGHPEPNTLLEASNGKLYGLTVVGGTNGDGVLFEYDIDSDTYTQKIDFEETTTGRFPYSSLTEATNGHLYGVCKAGGSSSEGTLFEYNITSGNLSVKVNFSGNSNGGVPMGGLFEASNGILYGMSRMGGENDHGILYGYDPLSSSFTKKVDFQKLETGQYPEGKLMEASNGKMYGLTLHGGVHDVGFSQSSGTLFEYNTGATSVAVKKVFSSSLNGHSPNGGLLLANDGNFYGTTEMGGIHGQGTIYRINATDNTHLKIHDFDGSENGGKPIGGLIEVENNLLYGMTHNGGSNNGIIYKYNYATNSFTKILEFDSNNGSEPYGSLYKASNNKIYGMTQEGGQTGKGVLFELNNEVYTKLVDFMGESNGAYPTGSLIEAPNGMLYGLTPNGGVNNVMMGGNGVLFEFNPNTNTYTKKQDFNDYSDPKGKRPTGSLFLASNGKLYGMTATTLFEYTPTTNTLITKHSIPAFNGSNGSNLMGDLMQSSNGKLYGYSNSGGDNNLGILFEYDPITDAIVDKLSFNKENGAKPEYGHLVEVVNPNYTWIGTIDSSWFNPLNWAGQNIPDILNNVIIPVGRPNYPHLSDTAVCANLTLKSNAYGDATFIENQMLFESGDITIERYLSGFNSSNSGWHYLSSPMQDINIANSDFAPSMDVDDLYRWDEPTNEWSNFNGNNFNEESFDEGSGYLVGYSVTTTKHFIGDLNDDTLTQVLSYSPGMGNGWNLLGNPYSSAIKWDSIIKTENMDGSFYIIDPTNGTYLVSNSSGGDIPNGEIPVNQAFLVKSNSTTDSVIFTTNAQILSSNSFNKSYAKKKESLVVQLNGENSTNKTYVQFNDNATLDYDRKIDAYKLFGYSDIAQVYTEINETKYAINNITYSDETISIALNIQILNNESLSFDFTRIDSFGADASITLEDLQTGEMTNLKQKPNYTFQANTEDDPNRFMLHFSGLTNIENHIEANNDINIYYAQNAIYIDVTNYDQTQIKIFNINGQLIKQKQLQGHQLEKVFVDLPMGIYLIQIHSNRGISNKKLFIK